MDKSALKKGTHEDYQWYELGSDLFLSHFVDMCFKAFGDRYVVITSFDSGPYKLSKEEKRAGWITQGSLAYSPKLRSLNPLQSGEFDEWYLFEDKTSDTWDDVFVNDTGWTLAPTDVEPIQKAQSHFWQLIQRIRPETYIADGDLLIVATRNKKIAAAIDHIFKK